MMVNEAYFYTIIERYLGVSIPGYSDGSVYALAYATGGSVNVGSLTEGRKEANARYIYDYLHGYGWTKEAICGLLGNIQQESQLNPGAWEVMDRTDRGYGLVQWTPNQYSPVKFLQKHNWDAI